MADNNHPITCDPIPELVINSGADISIDLRKYFHSAPDDTLTYTGTRFPEGLQIDSKTGVITGIAPSVDINTPYLVSVTVIGEESEASLTEYFPITVLTTAALGEPEAYEDEGIVAGVMSESYFTELQRWQMQRWIEHIIQEHYSCVILYNGEAPPDQFGKLLSKREAKTGFSIFNFEYYLVAAIGKMAYEEDGNRGRMIKTIEEMYEKDLPLKKWAVVGITGSDLSTVGKAWVVARLMHLPVSENAPTDEALFNLRILSKIKGIPITIATGPMPG